MGLRFRKRVQIMPGVRINVSKSSTSLTFGAKGASVNVGKRGVYANAGIPGTGIYSREKIYGAKKTTNYKARKNRSDSEIINENPARFFVLFFSFFLGVTLPLFTSASWWFFVILPVIGIIVALMIPNKNSSNEIKENKKELHQTAVEKKETIYTPSRQTSPSSNRLDMSKDLFDPLFEEAARLIVVHQQSSTSLIQRSFSIGYSRAGHIMDQLEKAGIVGCGEGSKSRQVMYQNEKDLEMCLTSLLYPVSQSMENENDFYSK